MTKIKSNDGLTGFLGLRIKEEQLEEIATLSRRYELSASVIVRQALKLGLRKFDDEAFRNNENQ